MAENLNFSKYASVEEPFEIEILVRDSEGNPTGQKKTFKTDNPHKLWEFYNRHQGRPKRRKNKKRNVENKNQQNNKKESLPNDEQGKKILREIYGDDKKEQGNKLCQHQQLKLYKITFLHPNMQDGLKIKTGEKHGMKPQTELEI